MSGIHVSDVGDSPLFKVMYEDQSADEEKQHHTVEKPSLSSPPCFAQSISKPPVELCIFVAAKPCAEHTHPKRID